MYKNVLILIPLLFLTNCSVYDNNKVVSNPITNKKVNPGLFSKDSEKGLSLDDLLDKDKRSGDNINVNAFLWRASIDVVSVAPINSTYALGGTIITDWYTNSSVKDQRMKISVFLLGSELRSDGIKVKVYMQNLIKNNWSNTYENKELSIKIENAILNEARNLRVKAFTSN